MFCSGKSYRKKQIRVSYYPSFGGGAATSYLVFDKLSVLKYISPQATLSVVTDFKRDSAVAELASGARFGEDDGKTDFYTVISPRRDLSSRVLTVLLYSLPLFPIFMERAKGVLALKVKT